MFEWCYPRVMFTVKGALSPSSIPSTFLPYLWYFVCISAWISVSSRNVCIVPLMFMVQCKSQGQKSWMGYSPWGRKESDTAECLSMQVAANFKKKKKEYYFSKHSKSWSDFGDNNSNSGGNSSYLAHSVLTSVPDDDRQPSYSPRWTRAQWHPTQRPGSAQREVVVGLESPLKPQHSAQGQKRNKRPCWPSPRPHTHLDGD